MTAGTDLETCALPAVVDAMAGNTGARFRFRRDGAPAEATYDRCRADAGALAAALRERGVGPGSLVAVHGATSYEWVLADLACLLCGALSVALYASAPPDRAVAAAVDSGCRVVLTDRADAAPLFAAAGLDVVLLTGPPGAGAPRVLDLIAAAGPDGAPAARRDGPFTVVSTSGTLSEPKLFTVHSRPLLATMAHFAATYGFGAGDRLLVYLPLSHLPQRMMLYGGLRLGLDFVLSDPARMPADTAAHRPTLHVTVPRVLEHVRARTAAALARTGSDSPAARAGAYRQAFGDGLKALFVGSAPTDPELLAELLAAGLPVYEVYGTTELGMIGLNTPVARRPGTVGKPIPWGEVRLDPDTREILVRTPTPFLHGRLTPAGIQRHEWDPDRFEPTADVGELVDGFLSVRGRLRDFLPLPSGEKVFLTPIESALERATGAGLVQLAPLPTGKLGALLFFDGGPVLDRCALVERIVGVNRTLHPWERVRAYAAVNRLPTLEEGCLTETTKPRRHVIEQVHGRTADWRRLGPA